MFEDRSWVTPQVVETGLNKELAIGIEGDRPCRVDVSQGLVKVQQTLGEVRESCTGQHARVGPRYWTIGSIQGLRELDNRLATNLGGKGELDRLPRWDVRRDAGHRNRRNIEILGLIQ